MRGFMKVASVFCLGAALCLADTWTGKLVDAACKAKQTSEGGTATVLTCEPMRTTTKFGIELSDGKVLSLDSAGNAKAAAAVREGRSATATVTGSLDGTTVKVDSIDIQ